MTSTVYPTQNGIANTILCLRRSIGEKFSMVKKSSDRKDPKATVRVERCEYYRSRGVPGSCTHAA